jgi:lambda family phage tail tape measure protein
MAELATLGIEAKAQGVEEASRSLDKLSGAAKRAESAVEGIGSTSSKAGQMAARSANEAATALNAEAVAANKAAGAMKLHAAAANQNVRVAGAASHNVGNLAAQFQDVAVTAAMGMSPLQIALQQGTQLSAVLGPMGAAGAVRSLGAAFLSVISPVSLLVIGVVALAAAGLQMVNWSKLAASGLTLLANSLQTIAPYAAIAAAGLALLYAPAMIGGVVQLIALLARLQIQALTLAATFAAANPAAAFVIGVTAAVVAANIFRDELTQVLGVDIVGAAKTGVNYIIGSFVAAFEDIKFVWANLPNIVGAAAIGATNAVINAVNAMINGAKMQVNSLIAAINTIPGVNIGALDTAGGTISNLENPYADKLAAGAGDRNEAVNGALSKDYLGGFGGAITKGASAASAKLKELAKDLTTVDDKSKKKGGGGGKTEAEKYSDIVDGANRRIASLKAEQQALGMTEQAALALKYETDLLNQAQQKGINLTAAQKAELAGLAQQMAATEIATKNAKEALDFAKNSTNGFLSDLRSGLANGEGLFKSFGKAALNVLNKVIDKVQNQLVDALFSLGGSGAAGGRGGGIFGGILGGIGKLFGFASGGYTGNGAATKAAGIVHGGEYVFSAKATKKVGVGNLESMHKAAKGYASGGYVAPSRATANGNRRQDSPVQVIVGVSADNNGNLMPFVESVSQRNVAQAAPKIVSTANQQVVPTMARYQNDTAGGDYRNG